MNTADQVLRKRCQTLERRTAWLEDVVRALLRDLDFTESVGAAFAFDAGFRVAQLSTYKPVRKDELLETLGASWDEAVKALEGEQDAARGIRRAHDGSIISTLPPSGDPEYDKAAKT